MADEGTVVAGLDIGGTQVRAALARGRQIVASQATTWPSGCSAVEEVHFIADLVLGLARETGLAEVRAVGVSLAALMNPDGVVVEWPNRPSWRGLAVRPLLEARLGLPIAIEDDANAAALAEWAFGAGQGFRHVLVMMVGTGVGAGLILDGRLFRGRHGWAGELGHQVMLPDGPPCPCGLRGCLQVLASGRALERAAVERGLADGPALVAAAGRGEAWAGEVLAASGRWIGLAAANAVNLLDLEAVVIGGGLSGLGPPWWPAIEAALRANMLNPAHRDVVLRRAALPDTAGVLGAVGLALELL